jgi:hypothetical protein
MHFSTFFCLFIAVLCRPRPAESHPIQELPKLDPIRQNAIALTEDQAEALRRELGIPSRSPTRPPLVRQNALTEEEWTLVMARLHQAHPDMVPAPQLPISGLSDAGIEAIGKVGSLIPK